MKMIRHEAISIDTKRNAHTNVPKDAKDHLHEARIDKAPLAIPGHAYITHIRIRQSAA